MISASLRIRSGLEGGRKTPVSAEESSPFFFFFATQHVTPPVWAAVLVGKGEAAVYVGGCEA